MAAPGKQIAARDCVALRAASACLENRRHPSGRSSLLFVEHFYQPRAARLTWAIPVRLKML
jgi:hypothetical protein